MKPIKAYHAPYRSVLVTECSDGSSFLQLGRLDGFYLNSRTEKGAHVLVSMLEPIVPIEKGKYRLATDEEYDAFQKKLHEDIDQERDKKT
jgi:hypothetical protein